jgi:hypothetical protein
MNWVAGTVSGPLRIESTGALNLSGSDSKSLYNALTNAGTVVWGGSGVLVVRNTSCLGILGLIENLAGALFDIQSDQAMYHDYNMTLIHNSDPTRLRCISNAV